MPLAYMDNIFSSISPLRVVWFFFTSCGSNSPFRSRGMESSISPRLLFTVFLEYPFRLLSVSLFR